MNTKVYHLVDGVYTNLITIYTLYAEFFYVLQNGQKSFKIQFLKILTNLWQIIVVY